MRILRGVARARSREVGPGSTLCCTSDQAVFTTNILYNKVEKLLLLVFCQAGSFLCSPPQRRLRVVVAHRSSTPAQSPFAPLILAVTELLLLSSGEFLRAGCRRDYDGRQARVRGLGIIGCRGRLFPIAE